MIEMKINFLFIFILFFSLSYEENSIIQIPNIKQRIIKDIKTKNGLIDYGFNVIIEETGLCYPYFFSQCYISKINNLKLFKLPEKTKEREYILNKKELIIKLEGIINDECNPLICEVLYKTKYINNYIYSIGKNELNESYKFFGGTPKKLVKNYNKFIFQKYDLISEIKIKFNNGNNSLIKVSLEESFYEINEGKNHLICFPEKVFKEMKKLVFNNYNVERYNFDFYFFIYIYSLLNEQKNLFPEISFKIGNNIFTLNKDNAFLKGKNDTHYKLFINSFFCDKFIFGMDFLDLFDFKEFNLETKEVYLYLDKNKNYLIKEKEDNKDFLKSNLNIWILFYFLIALIILSLFKKYHKNKRIEYYNIYYDILD